MKEKVMEWLEKHYIIYGSGLLFISLCMVAFGGAYLGAEQALSNSTVSVSLYNSGNEMKAVINE